MSREHAWDLNLAKAEGVNSITELQLSLEGRAHTEGAYFLQEIGGPGAQTMGKCILLQARKAQKERPHT